MVQHRSRSTGSTIDHFEETAYLDQGKQDIFPIRHFELKRSIDLLIHQIDSLVKTAKRLRNQLQGNQLHLLSKKRRTDSRIGRTEQTVARDFIVDRTTQLFGIVHYNIRPFISLQELRPERPAGTDNQIAGHIKRLRLVKSHLQHVNPFVAQPR